VPALMPATDLPQLEIGKIFSLFVLIYLYLD